MKKEIKSFNKNGKNYINLDEEVSVHNKKIITESLKYNTKIINKNPIYTFRHKYEKEKKYEETEDLSSLFLDLITPKPKKIKKYKVDNVVNIYISIYDMDLRQIVMIKN